jgi:hypothetical protein
MGAIPPVFFSVDLIHDVVPCIKRLREQELTRRERVPT